MQSEDFDKKIRDAADNHHPSYNEKAWTKMEKLLDKHLPNEKDDRRRIIFFVLMFLLLGGGTWFFISKPWKTTPVLSQTTMETSASEKKAPTSSTTTLEPAETTTEKSSTTNQTNPSSANTGANTTAGEPATVKTGQPTSNNAPGNDLSVTTSPAPARSKPVRQQAGDDFGIVTGAPGTRKKLKKQDNPPVSTEDKAMSQSQKNSTPVEPVQQQADQVVTEKETQKETVVTNVNPPFSTITNTEEAGNKKDTPKDPVTETTPPVTVPKKQRKKKPTENGLALTLSAGPDLSFVGNRTGEWKPVVGAGLSYTFAKRFTVRTGFYTASKVYSAAPSDYKPKSPPPTPEFLKLIEADCKVYEIPLTIAWNFAKKKNNSWFGAAGLSSYIMKEEKYDYIYQYPGGPPWTYNWDLKNKNNHVLSVLSLSAGYTRKLGRIFSFTAEPYFKMPLNGVGFGNVKLNSTGVLFTLSTKLTGNQK